MDYRDRVRIAAMQSLMQQGGFTAAEIAQKAEIFADEMCKARNKPTAPVEVPGYDY